MTTRRGGRPPQVRPRPPSTGRPAPIKARSRPPAPGRLADHRRVERNGGIAFPLRLLLVLAVVVLGGGVLLIASGGVGRVTAMIGTTVDGLLADLTATPAPSTALIEVADAPVLQPPDEPYTNEASVDLSGTIPTALAGQANSIIRIYVRIGDGGPGTVGEWPVGPTPRFLIPGIGLSPGTNTFSATIVGPTDLESEPSATIAYVLDTTKPKITLTAPRTNAVVNARTVKLVGKTQGRSTLSAHNLTTNATVAGAADNSGAFSLVLPIGNGVNKIEVSASDPAGNLNTMTVSVRRGSGALTANLSASFYQVRVAKLPEPVQLTVSVTDPDGRALAGAEVTFTLAIPGVPAIASSPVRTSTRGTAAFSTTIPRGANPGQISITVIVRTSEFGNVTDQTVVTIQR